MKIAGIIVCSLIIIVFMIVSQINFRERSKKEMEKAERVSIIGKLSQIAVSNGSVYIQVEGSSERFTIIPIQEEGGQYFSNVASIGDRIEKKAYSDTMLLFKGEKVYSYTLRK
nr:hypothetical protein [Pedobacter panaciterrae]